MALPVSFCSGGYGLWPQQPPCSHQPQIQQAGPGAQQYGAAGYSHADKTDYLLGAIFHA
jgi:hypothetical protein